MYNWHMKAITYEYMIESVDFYFVCPTYHPEWIFQENKLELMLILTWMHNFQYYAKGKSKERKQYQSICSMSVFKPNPRSDPPEAIRFTPVEYVASAARYKQAMAISSGLPSLFITWKLSSHMRKGTLVLCGLWSFKLECTWAIK